MAKRQNLDLNKLLPSSLKNETLTSLVSNMFNRFVSEEKSVFINGRIGKPVTGDANIQQPTLDREVNALTPALYFKAGTEENVYMFEDMVNKLNVLDADVDNMRAWMAEQSFNYTLPINYDKLINYANYFWVGNSIKNTPNMPWNSSVNPEFYVIERPAYTDLTKMPVDVATTRHINLWSNDRPVETFTLTFTSNSTFTITSDLVGGDVIVNTNSLVSTINGDKTAIQVSTSDSDVAPGLSDPNNANDSLFSFSIINGPTQFAAGDYFEIKVTYFTSQIYVTQYSPSLIGKGTINGAITTSSMMYIDDVLLQSGMRVLVKDQIDPSENGIYRVSNGKKWARTADANQDDYLVVGSQVYVESGTLSAGKTFELTNKIYAAPLPDGTLQSEFMFTALAVNIPKGINQWQEFNYWFHRDDFADLEAQGLSVDTSVQATRPIIEYSNKVALNSKMTPEGIPNPTGSVSITQVKTRLNQIPQFDLFRYDGTPHEATSGIFFYAEDPDFSVDTVLQRRVKTTENYDYIFGVGLKDEQGRLLYYKLDGELKSVWRPGVATPTATTPVFKGGVDRGALTINSIDITADNQDWAFTCISPTEFSVYGSRSGDLGILSVGTIFIADDVQVTIANGINSFVAGETFTFSINAPLTPRYVKKLADGSIVNYPGWVVGDRSDAVIDGTWMTPLRMFQNLERETRLEIALGDLMEHMRGVIRNQDGFTGTSFGNNNVRTLDFDPGLGGNIREFGSNFPLLASMLIQKDVSPLTMIDFAEQQYNVALSSIDQFMINELANYIATLGEITTTSIDPFAADIQALANYFESLRAIDENLKLVFGDTTAKVKNWPVTLPMIGMLNKVLPIVSFDAELGIETIIHHDGHSSPLATRDADFDRALVQSIVKRSDGTSSAGIFSESAPSSPYARQLWMKPSVFELKFFDVNYDSNTIPVVAGQAGEFWYKRSTNQLYEWDTVGSAWVLSLTPISDRWVPLSTASIRNSLVLAIEQRLYDSVHPAQQINLDVSMADGSQYAEIELARFSAKYNYDTFAPDYKATDAFTWNYYSEFGIPNMPSSRWHDVLKNNFNVPGLSLPTCRPNLEPWKLLNFATKPAGWDSTYAATNPGSSNIVIAKYLAKNNLPILFGLQAIDGVPISNGDRILVIGQSLPQFNGLYIASSGGWARTADPIVNQLTVSITNGYEWGGSVWSVTTPNPIIVSVDDVTFEQVRLWQPQMWQDIKNARPTLKLSVNVNTDMLIPPYVSATKFESAEALTTTIPTSAQDGYPFGQNGPIETVWQKSLEYSYGLSRSQFRLSPLQFLDKTWGETYMTVGDNLRVERNVMRSLSAADFLMHGEKLNIINSYTPEEIQKHLVIQPGGHMSWVQGGKLEFEVTHCADNLTVFYVYSNGVLIGSVNEGVPFTFSVDGFDFADVMIDDLGIPFELGDKIAITFYDDIVDPNYVPPVLTELELGCEGCVADGEPDAPTNIPMVQVQPTYAHIAATVKKFKGTGQWFTDLLRFSYIDTDVSQASLAYRGWDLKLAHRIGALIRQDSLKINTVLGYLPSTAYNVILKRSVNTESKWISGIRVQLVQMGARKFNAVGTIVPANDASDWIFRVETYNPQHPSAEYYELQTSKPNPNPLLPPLDGDHQTFYAIDKRSTDLVWKKYTEKVSLQTTTTPITITGLQNVITFIFGYVDRLTELGWQVNADDKPVVDTETGRNLDWQLEVEKLIDSVYASSSAGQGHILNPFMEKIILDTPIGLMSRYTESNFIDAYSTQAAFDVTGTVIPLEKLTVVRTDDVAVTYSNTPIFSAHVFIDEYEHAILMNKKFSEENSSTSIFDPFLGLKIDTAYLSYVRQDDTTRKPTFDGFFLSGNDVKRNIVSGIDNIGNYYDAGQTFSEQSTADHALALLGYTRKDYFTDIGINNTTQFNFWRGLVQAKGTNMTIDAFVNYKKFNDASVDEYWAYKLATYGDARERSFPEIKVGPTDVTQKFARFQFYSSQDANYDPLPLFIQVENSDDSRWFSIDDLGKGMKFEAQNVSETVVVDPFTGASQYIRLNNIFHNGDAMGPVITGPSGASVIGASLVKVTQPGTYTMTGYTWLNPSKLSPIKLFDYEEKTLVDEIGLWHPAIGIHAYAPLEVVNMINAVDPAHYNYTTQTTSNANYRHLKPWGEREVGRVWWDTSNLDYIPYYDATIFPNRDTRHARWGSLAEWASVDLYEWTASDVHPSEYDALASSQEGSSEIDPSLRASGKVGLQKYYTRERIITVRPIAWSEAGVGNGNAHPSFGPAEFTSVYVSGNRLIADKGRTADANLINGRNFGGWKNNKPVGEVVIGSDITFTIGSLANPGAPVLIPGSAAITSFTVSEIEGGVFGTRIGAIQLLKKDNGDSTFILRMMDNSGYYEDQEVVDWYSNNMTSDSTKTIKFNTFGLQLTATRASASSGNEFIYSEDFIDALTNPLNDIYIRETVDFETIIPLTDTLYVNDETDPNYSITEYEWKTWSVPSQDDLNADLVSPRNTWRPYLGDAVVVEATAAVVKAMKDSGSTLTLKNGISIDRFSSSWTDWVQLLPVRQQTISNGVDTIEFVFPSTIDVNRLSMYANGVQINPSGYVITDNLVQIVNVLPEGTDVMSLYRAYQPTEEELSFDPSVSDDVSIQTQYKRDYQYTSLEIRDAEGNITGTKYYFWVQDKTIPQLNKSMSLVQAKSILKAGPSSYTIFSRLLADTSASPTGASYDSCAIAGLGSMVSKDDSYKLRFLRDFTLRDDPEELNLKNVHTEWTLIRKLQRAKIPKTLWNALTDAISGEDIGGKPLPSQVRVDYDLRNNTRTRFGFQPGQIFADTDLVKKSVTNTILNTSLTIQLANKTISDFISALDFTNSNEWFADPQKARVTMDLIWATARASQINEIFFSVLDDALANNYEFSDLFKTSYITVSSSTVIEETKQWEQVDEQY